jgi:hypothetical protein
MSSAASVFASHARGEKVIIFECALDCKVGAYSLTEGDGIKAVSDGYGLYHVYVAWAEGSIGRLRAAEINKLAGRDVIYCSCMDPVHPGDSPNCEIHAMAGGG